MEESLADIADEIKKSDIYSKGVQKKTERMEKRQYWNDNWKIVQKLIWTLSDSIIKHK